jgi:acyl-CoA thioesterase-1
MMVAGMVMVALAACQSKVEAPLSAQSAADAGPVVRGPARSIVALGDSLLAGYGLRPNEAYPPRLEAALRSAGINARVVNAGVSGDTTADGLARIDFTLGNATPDLVLISLGGNDMLRGLSPAQTRANLDGILTRLDARHVPVVLLGMMAAPNMGADYARAFDAIYPDLAKKHHATLVPFFMAPINGKDGLQLPDHIHPTPTGVEAMVKATVDTVAGALPKG